VVALLRYFGKRALTKTNAFDLVVTVAIGSAFASAFTSKDTSLADGVPVCRCSKMRDPGSEREKVKRAAAD
jgi:uncharacterized membrane protein YcaP (DUF421 family)